MNRQQRARRASLSTQPSPRRQFPRLYEGDTSMLLSTFSNSAEEAETLSAGTTRRINILRAVTMLLLTFLAALAAGGVYRYTSQQEQDEFEQKFYENSHRIQERFLSTVERKLSAIHSLADMYTSHALVSGETFPMVTLPHFALHAANVRIQSNANVVRWTPLVTDDTREAWEAYALEHRFEQDADYELGVQLRDQQDAKFGLNISYIKGKGILVKPNDTVVDDGTGYHPHIFSNGATTPRGDEPAGTGPYLPMWQRNPINSKRQSTLNNNFVHTKIFTGMLEKVLETKEAIMHGAVTALKANTATVTETLQASQHREKSIEYLEDPFTYVAYPVFDSFEEDRKIVGVLGANTYWRQVFADLLGSEALGYIVVLENSYNQTLTYRIDGTESMYLGEGDFHDASYDHLHQEADINDFIEVRASVRTRAFTQVPLNRKYGRYRINIYPSQDTYQASNKPWIYTGSILAVFVVTAFIVVVLDRFIAQRQKIVMDGLLYSAEERAEYERELSEFIAHEVRNPVAAAMTAYSFVSSSVQKISSEKRIPEEEVCSSLKDDCKVIGTSLLFVNDFLRSVLDVHACAAEKLKVKMSPTDLLTQCFEPVRTILYEHDDKVEVSLECPEELVVMTDNLRLQQVLINLGRNSLKFTKQGFVRFQATIVKGFVDIYVEDSGPGIPEEKRGKLFDKYQSSLDVLSQGTGVGLALSKELVALLKGNIYLDETYDSGVPGCPGARFVISLNQHVVPTAILSAWKSSSNSDAPSLLEDPFIGETVTVIPDPLRDLPPKERGNKSPGTGNTSIPEPPRAFPPEEGGNSALGTGNTSDTTHETNEQETVDKSLPEHVSVLFVDDDKILRRLFGRAVKKVCPEWSVSDAESGEAALERLDEGETFDLIFMDQYMASTEKSLLGTETVREIRKRGDSNSATTIICGLSANNMEEGFLESGADAFLIKPIPCAKKAMEKELIRICHSRDDKIVSRQGSNHVFSIAV